MMSMTAAALALCLTAGGVRSQQQHTRGDLTEEFHQTYQLAPGGRVHLENINGDVRVRGWDRPEVKVDAVKYAHTRERLEEARIEVDVTPQSVHIETRYPYRSTNWTSDHEGRRNNPATVEYVLTVPRGALISQIELINGALDMEGLTGDVRASSINGKVTARDLTGPVRLSTINGPLEATFASFTNPISLGSVNGPVSIFLPSDADAEVRAGTVHGAITNEFNLPVKRGRYVGHNLAGRFGAGTMRVKLDNVNGPIRLRRAQDNRPLGPVTNLLSETVGGEGEWDGVDREIDEGVSEAAREAQREVREALRESKRERDQERREREREKQQEQREREREKLGAQRDHLQEERERKQEELERQRERVQEQSERERERLEEQREREREKLEVQRERQEALRETEQERREALREAEEERRRLRTEATQVAREAARVSREVSREVARAMGGRDRDNSGDQRQIERVSNTLAAVGVPRVRVENFDGPITVIAWDKPEVMYTAVKRAHDQRELQGISIKTQTDNTTNVNQGTTARADSTVTISTSFDKSKAHQIEAKGAKIDWYSSDASVELEVYVPRKSVLSISSADGRLRVDGVNGEITMHTGDGGIDVSEARGRLRADTNDGRINIVNFNGDVTAQTGDGRILLEGDFGALSARTGDGSISLVVPEGASAIIETNAETVVSDGMAVEEGAGAGGGSLRRWKVGAGGRVYTLRTGDGQIILRRR
ncbi:MAG TPA: DUF4097 family beta strand repeat-containing protein [Pyrinomonadaceae bacterium]